MGEIPILTIFIVSPPYAHTSDFLQCIRCFVNLLFIIYVTLMIDFYRVALYAWSKMTTIKRPASDGLHRSL